MRQLIAVAMSCWLALLAPPALAYVEPGPDAGTIGGIIGFLISIFLALIALFWYPIKRLYKKITGSKPPEQ